LGEGVRERTVSGEKSILGGKEKKSLVLHGTGRISIKEKGGVGIKAQQKGGRGLLGSKKFNEKGKPCVRRDLFKKRGGVRTTKKLFTVRKRPVRVRITKDD